MLTRGELEHREDQWLASFAMRSSQTRGRAYSEQEPAYRTAYQRDRDRIIHTTAFRRLEYKTQVFVYSEGDHYRNRLTHSVEVAQIGRTLARALGCNEDLTEAICLAHDLGHPPFGHTGEWTLNDLMHEHGGFNHQKQTYRIVTELERRYDDHPGLNLTYEVLEGVVKHDTDYDIVDARDYHPDERGTLECQVSNLADEIAYNTSDLDDGLRSGILDPVAVRNLEVAQRVLAGMDEAPDADLSNNLMRYRFIRELVGMEVSDVVAATEQNLTVANVQSLAGLRRLPQNAAGYTPVMLELNKELKAYLLSHFYRHFRVMRMAAKARRLITDLFAVYTQDAFQLPTEVQQRVRNEPGSLHRVVCDYIAGMTDRYAIQEHKRLFDPEERA